MEYKNEEGKSFIGQFDKDQKEGVGFYYLPNNRVYCGQFRQDAEEGVGEYLLKKDI